MMKTSIACLLGVLASALPAQTPYPDLLFLGDPHAIIYHDSFDSSPDPDYQTGMYRTWGACGWTAVSATDPTVYDSHFLLVGELAAGVGVIRHFHRTYWPEAYTLVSSTTLSWIPGGVAFDPVADQVYLADNSSKMVSRATWDGFSPVSTIAPQNVFDANPYWPAAGDAPPRLILLGTDFGWGPVLTVPGDRLRISARSERQTVLDGEDEALVIVDLTTLVGQAPLIPPLEGDNFALDGRSVRHTSTSVTVTVGAGMVHTYTLVNADTGTVLGAVVQSATDTEVDIPSSTPLVVGTVYGVYRDGVTAEMQEQRCFARYGVPGKVGAGGSIEMGRIYVTDPFEVDTAITVSCQATAAVSTPVAAVTAVTFGLSSVTGPPPILLVGPDVYIINNSQTFPFEVVGVQGTIESWLVYEPFVIPNTPQMIGSVFLLQTALGDAGGVLYLSDIIGAMVLPPQ